MSLLTQLGGFFGGGGGIPMAEDSDVRTVVQFPEIPGEREVTTFNRKAINKKGKYVVSTLGLGRALNAGLPRYITPINPYPSTDDTDWNKYALDAWQRWSESKMMCDVRQTVPYRKMQRQGCQAMFRAGEYFNHYVRTASGYRPRIQMLDETQIDGRPYELIDRYPEEFRDGVRYSKTKAPIGYVYKKSDGSRELLNRNRVTHCYDPERIGQGRGVTWLYTGAGSAVDMLDLAALEKQTGKLHSALAAVVKSRSGDDKGKGLNRRMNDLADKMGLDGGSTNNSSGNKLPKNHPLLNELNGVLVKYLNLDEEISFMSSNRPNSVWLGFMDYIARDVASSFGVPVEFVWQIAGLTGANTRTVLRQAQTFISDVQDLLVDMEVRETYVKVIASEMLLYERTNGADGIPPCKDPEWWKAEYHGPEHVTIDNGKDTKADTERLRHGMLAIPDYWRNRNKDPNRQRRIQIDWLSESMKECEEKGVPFEYFFAMNLPGQIPVDPSEEKPEDDDKKDNSDEEESDEIESDDSEDTESEDE